MTQGSPLRLIITFALPLMAGNVFQHLHREWNTRCRWGRLARSRRVGISGGLPTAQLDGFLGVIGVHSGDFLF